MTSGGAIVYANHAGTSWPKPPEVRDAVGKALVAHPAEGARLLDEAREAVASFLGLAHPERLLFTPGCTSALAVALADLPWEDGDVVVTSSLEHHALARPVEQLVRSRGVRHEPAPYRPGEPIDLGFVEEVLRRGRVRLVAATAASNVTGEVLPTARLAALAHEHGALFLADVAQTAGVLPDHGAAGADLVAFAGHKALQGPQGIGGLWAAPGVAFACPGAACEIAPRATRTPRGAASFPGYCDAGSANVAGAAGLAAGVRWLREGAGSGLREQGCDLARRLVEALGERPGVTLFGSPGAGRTAAVSLRIDRLPLGRAEAFFRERGIAVRAGGHCAPMALRALGAPEGTLRISFGPTSRSRDVDLVIEAIDGALAGG